MSDLFIHAGRWAMLFDGFTRRRIDTGEAVINLVTGGGGPPLLLLHGYPQTHACWHRIAPALSRTFTVVAPDLRGYGDSTGPAGDGGLRAYAKRTMAADMVTVMAALGHGRFGVAGHDRGGRVAYRLALDHPDRVDRLAVLDIVPTLDMVEMVDRSMALAIYHWFFLAQPFDLPERLVGADPDFYLDWTIRSWWAGPDPPDTAALADYRRAFRRRRTIHAACEDYRAGMAADIEADRADRDAGRRIGCPLLALWAETATDGRPYDVVALWRRWADDVRGQALPCGHFLAEEAPDAVAAALLEFFGPTVPC